MDVKSSFQNALENLKAMILAANPRDRSALARLGSQVEELLRTLQPEVPEFEFLSLVLSSLRSAGSLETATGLRVVAGAVAELSQQAGRENEAKRHRTTICGGRTAQVA